MAYNGNFPMGYPMQQYYPQYSQLMQQNQQMQPMSQAQNQQQNYAKIWVQGESGAKSYLVAPNTTVDLWDSERQTIYIKSADASGMPSMKILDYKLRQTTDTTPQTVNDTLQNDVNYVTHEELKVFEDKIMRKVDEIKEEVQA